MQLTKHTDYAFRVLIYLSNMQEERTTIQTISQTYDISKSHIMKVVNELVNKGWVDSIRGKNGGICLGVQPKDISLKDVILLMEKNLDPINCNSPVCYINGVCKLKSIVINANNQYLNHMGQYTLADVASPKIRDLIAVSNGH